MRLVGFKIVKIIWILIYVKVFELTPPFASPEISRPKLSFFPLSQTKVNCLKTIPFKVAHTYIVYIWK